MLGTLAGQVELGVHFLGDQRPVFYPVVLVELLQHAVFLLEPNFLFGGDHGGIKLNIRERFSGRFSKIGDMLQARQRTARRKEVGGSGRARG